MLYQVTSVFSQTSRLQVDISETFVFNLYVGGGSHDLDTLSCKIEAELLFQESDANTCVRGGRGVILVLGSELSGDEAHVRFPNQCAQSWS